MKEKLQNYKTKSIIATIILLMLVFTAAYAFFTISNNPGLITNTSIGNKLNISYILSANSNLTLNVDPINPESNTVHAHASINTDFVSLANNSSDAVMCTYEIWYTPTTTFNDSTYNSTKKRELTLSGTDSSGQNSAFEYDLNGITTSKKIYEGYIQVAAGQSLNQTWTFTLTHYNIDPVQNNLLNHTYSGVVSFKATGCGEPTSPFLVEQRSGTSSQDATDWAVIAEADGYRYEGKDPDNYLCFSSSCTDDELYRIIGSFREMIDTDNDNVADTYQNVMKVIKYKALSTAMPWDSSSANWTTASINTYLNSTWTPPIDKSKIVTTRWHLGGLTYTFQSPANVYSQERSGVGGGTNSSYPATWDGKIGLMYGSDYAYAVLESNCSRSKNLHDYKGLFNNNYNIISGTECYPYDWLYYGSESININANETWTINGTTNSDSSVAIIRSGGELNSYNYAVNAGIRPAFYLNESNYEIASGTGAKTNPYRLRGQVLTYYLDSTPYQFEDGMTWTEWVSSSYNTGGYFVYGSVITKSSSCANFYEWYIRNTDLSQIDINEPIEPIQYQWGDTMPHTCQPKQLGL